MKLLKRMNVYLKVEDNDVKYFLNNGFEYAEKKEIKKEDKEEKSTTKKDKVA